MLGSLFILHLFLALKWVLVYYLQHICIVRYILRELVGEVQVGGVTPMHD